MDSDDDYVLSNKFISLEAPTNDERDALGQPYDNDTAIPPRGLKTPAGTVEGSAPAPVIDTLNRPAANGTTKTTNTTTGQPAAQGASVNWGGLVLIGLGLWVLSQLGKEE